MDSQSIDMEKDPVTEEAGPILLLASDCDDLFQSILANDQASPSLKRYLDEYCDRFDSLAALLGVFAGRTASLDHRLRRHQDFQDMIARLLDILRRNLAALSQFTSNSQPAESSRQAGGKAGGQPQRPGEIGAHSQSKNAEPELNAAISGIAESISRLNKLGVIIRQSSRSTATARARRFAAQHLDLDAFEEITYQSLEILYPNTPETLRQQLSDTMTDRYVKHQYEAYRLGKSNVQYPTNSGPDDAESQVMTPEDDKQRSGISTGETLGREGDPRARHRIARYQQRASTIDTQLLQQNAAAARTSASRAPKTLSVFTENDRQNEPPPPKFEDGKDLTDCQWCFQLIDRSFVDESGWSDMGRDDLKPFVCIAEDCANSRPGYSSRSEWFDHMKTHSPAWSQSIHSHPMWRCNYDHENDAVYAFSSANNLSHHVLMHHKHENVAEEWASVPRATTNEIRPANVCPLCFLVVGEAGTELGKRQQRQEEEPEKLVKPVAKKRKVAFAEDISAPAEPVSEGIKALALEEVKGEEEKKEKVDQMEIDGFQATSHALAWHIAAHLQYLTLLSLRLMITHGEANDDDDIGGLSHAPESGASQSEERRAEVWDISSQSDFTVDWTGGETDILSQVGSDHEERMEAALSGDTSDIPDAESPEGDNWEELFASDDFTGVVSKIIGPTPRRLKDADFVRLTDYCRPHDKWSEYGLRPRTLALCLWLDVFEAMDGFLQAGLSDIALPYTEHNLPSCIKGSKLRTKFLEFQNYVLTDDAYDLERPDGPHLNIAGSARAHFEIIKELKRDGFSILEQVYSRLSLRQYALKTIPRGRSSRRDKQSLERVVNELRGLKRLSHQHLVKLIGSYTDSAYVGVISTPVPDTFLNEYLSAPGSSYPDRKERLRQFYGCLAGAVEYLHSNQIRHRDIKPGNISVLLNEQRVLLTGFDVVYDWSGEQDVGSDSSGDVKSAVTPRYGAPEVLAGGPRNSASDIWSLGCVYFEMSTVLSGLTITQMQEDFHANGDGDISIRRNRPAYELWRQRISIHLDLPDDGLMLQLGHQMLAEKPAHRPTANEIASQIAGIQGAINYHCGCLELGSASSSSENLDMLQDALSIAGGEEQDEEERENRRAASHAHDAPEEQARIDSATLDALEDA